MPNVSDPQDKGRRIQSTPNNNLMFDGVDFPEDESFEGAQPRTSGSEGGLKVLGVNMCKQTNEVQHFTSSYSNDFLVIRRGQDFRIQVTFNRQVTDSDDFQLEFLIGPSPSTNKGTLVVVPFGGRTCRSWLGRIAGRSGDSVELSVVPSAAAIVGKYRMYVAVAVGNNLQRTRRDATRDLYLLFNAWCPEDDVYIDDPDRTEYILNDSGVIYQGSVDAVATRNWVYGQFEHSILDACIHIMDSSRTPIYDRGNVIKVIRMGSAMINAQDDRGVCVGNWSDDYSMGRAPTSWTGSVRILLQYFKTGVPICYAQCWVFAGVFNTFLRALGIPARVVTNFNSAHDNTGNLKTDLVCKPDGSPDDRYTTDSIWNYHCWNEVWCSRRDLPAGFGGWQVVDATPQETSDGCYRCGPAPVLAIKEGLLFHPYDARFVFAEVNSDVVMMKRDRYGNMNPYQVLKTHIGLGVYTKALGFNNAAYTNITHLYKYPEGSPQDEQTMARAETCGLSRDHSEMPDTQLACIIKTAPTDLGQDVNLLVDFYNSGELPRTINATMACSVIYYTGVRSNHLKDHKFTVDVLANQMKSEAVTIRAQEYSQLLGSQLCLHFHVTGDSDGESCSAIKVVELQTPKLTLTLSGRPQVHQEMFVTVSFTNPFNFKLHNVHLSMEGPGLMSERERSYRVIDEKASLVWKEAFNPRLYGERCLVAVMDCSNIRQIWGVCYVHINSA